MGFVQQLQEFLRSLFQWWVTITPWQQGIRVRLGKHTKLLKPGIHLKLPIADLVYMQPIRVRATYIASQTLMTEDTKTIVLSSSLRYEITDLLKLYQTLHNAHDTVEQQVQGMLASYIFAKTLKDLKPKEVEKHIIGELDLSQFGLKVYDFNLTNFTTTRTYRLISGDVASYTGYDQRLETNKLITE